MASKSKPTSLTAQINSLKDIDPQYITDTIRRALYEDVSTGDITALSTVPADIQSEAVFLAKANGIISGIEVADKIFHAVDPSIKVEWHIQDGATVKYGQQFGHVKGPARSLLTAERTVLNIMQRMSGIATATRRYVDLIAQANSQTKVLDTRKTVPGLRYFDKLAVVHGSGLNHRIGLFDMFLVKDNHITASGGVQQALQNVYQYIKEDEAKRSQLKICFEVRTDDELDELLQLAKQYPIHRILLDNMVKVTYKDGNPHNIDTSNLRIDTTRLQKAVQKVNGQYDTEASGNINLGTIAEISKANPTYVSVGALTHSVMAFDISLKILEKDGKLGAGHTATLNG